MTESEKKINDARLLAELEEVLRTIPPQGTIRHDTEENLSWLGRAANVIERWEPAKAALFQDQLTKFHSRMALESIEGLRQIKVLLNQGQDDLLMRTLGPTSVAVGSGMVFEYFEELRKLIELAVQEVFFVDPYLDADFVARYLLLVQDGTTIRLLTANDPKRLGALLPAVDLFVRQHNHPVEVRSTAGMHDRYLLVDRTSCYQSGASFKDGAKKAGTIMSQVTDAFQAIWDSYDAMWACAKVERS
jgi:hypothetical protein